MTEKNIPRLDWFLVLSVMIVVLCGILTLYAQEANFSDGTGRWYKQLVFFVAGLAIIVLVARFNYQLLGYYALFIYLFSIFLLVLTLVPGIGYLPEGRGARSWLKLGFIGLQVSEFAKLANVILLGQYLVMKEKDMKNFTVLFVPFLISIIPMFLIILQPDFGTAISFLPILFTMLFLGGADIWHIGSLVIFGGISLSIPMYLEYSKLTLMPLVAEYLQKQGNTEVLSVFNKIGVKVWHIYEGREISSDMKQLVDNAMAIKIRDTLQIIKDEYASILFKIFHQESLLIYLGIILVIVSAFMIGLGIARGINLRNYYLSTGIIGLSLLFAVMIYKTIPFRENQVIRLTAFLSPDQFRQGAGYQLRASRTAVGSGQFLGKGFMEAEMTEGRIPHVPESGTDFIFASWAEQTGFLGSVILLFFLIAIPLRGLQISFESKDRFGSLLAAGIVALIFFHIAINIGIVLGLMPITGIPLTFMSYGGSHLLMSMTAVGIILSIKSRKHAN